ncbi:MAG: O-methyltransferase [Chitinophagaceae bacterium]|nr:O-methyltransferase [Chitinophagaceae bacterium]
MSNHIVSEKINQYAEQHTDKESELLYELNRQTHLKTQLPFMISGHLQGRFLSMISKMIQPTSILEIGTFTGYSALCLAEGLKEDGRLITIDNHQEQAAIAQAYFDRSAYKNKIQLIIGNAMEIISTLNTDFDIVFIDPDKMNYSNYYDLVFDKVRSGGYIITDNVLFHGTVILEENINKNTRAIQQFNEKLSKDNRIENVLLPIRDGILISRKK